jgi:hypothetical protein
MPNVILTHKFPLSEINKSLIFKKAWIYIRSGTSKKEAFKQSWEEATRLSVKFWTNAKSEDILWTIKSCQENGVIRKDLLRKWDNDRINHPLDWVSYHLRRNGFEIENIFNTNVYSLSYEIPKL